MRPDPRARPAARPAAALALLAAALCAAPAAGQRSSRDAGPVVLLGERATAAAVPELGAAHGPAVLLTPYPNPDCGRLALRLLGREAACHFVRPGDAERSDERALAADVRGAGLIGLWGGDQHDWYDVFWPHGNRSRLLGALVEAQRGGATVVGQGAAVAFLSAASAWDFSLPADPPVRRPAAPPHDLERPVLAWNLGLQPWAAIDTETRSEGSAWDLIDLLVAERLRLGAYLESDAALVFDPAVPELRARGAGAVWLLDLRGARSDRHRILGARFSLLADGDGWSHRERAVRSDATWLAPGDEESLELTGGYVLAQPSLEEVASMNHGPRTMDDLREQFGWSLFARRIFSEPRTLVRDGYRANDRRARLTLTPEEDSRVGRHDDGEADGPARVTLANLRLDLEWDL